MTQRYLRCILFSCLLGAVLLTGCGGERADLTHGEAVVARVGDTVLTRQRAQQLQIEARQASLYFPSMESVVNDWINDQLARQEAVRLGINKEPDIAWQIERYATRILRQELIEREVINELPEVTEADAVAYYEEHKEEYRSREPQVWLWIIEREDRESAEMLIRDKLAADGSNFREQAQLWSLGASQAQGGDRGYLNKTRLKPEIWQAAWELPLDTVSEVIPYRVAGGLRYAVIVVKDRVEEGDYLEPGGVGFDRLKDKAESEIIRETLLAYMDELRNQTRVFIDSELVAELDAYAEQTEAEIEDPTPTLE